MHYLIQALFSDLEAYVVMMGDIPVFPVSDLATVIVMFCSRTWIFMALCSCATAFSLYFLFKAAFYILDRFKIAKKE